MYRTKSTYRNNKFVNVFKSGLRNLKEKIENLTEEEKEIEKPNEIVDIVEKILKLHQRGQHLKILTSNQILNRLPISLAQLNAGNNSEKLKNEIGQLLYSLYRSKKLTKNIYKSLMTLF